MQIPLRLLIVEDSENDAQLVLREIRRGSYDVQYKRVETAPAMQAALEQEEWDLIICDYSLPSFDAPRALELLKASGKDLPFLILSGSIGEETAIAALKAGAHDFMLKGSLSRLLPAIQRELREAESRRERRRAEQALGLAQARLSGIIDLAADAIITIDKDQRIILFNQSAELVFGYQADEVLGRPLDILLPKQFVQPHRQYVFDFLEAPENFRRGDHRIGISGQRKDGKKFPAEGSISKLQMGGEMTFTIILRDVTERLESEKQIKRRIAELEVLYQSGLTFSGLHDPKAIGTEIIRILNEQLDWHHAAVRLRRKDSDEVELLAFNQGHEAEHASPEDETRAATLINQIGQGMTGWVIQHGQTVRCDDLQQDERYVETIPGMRSGLYVPLKVDEHTIGSIGVESDEQNAFDPDDERLLNTLAGQAAIALENARLLAEVQSRVNELGALVQVSAALRTAQTVGEILPRLLDESLDLFKTEAGSIWLYDPVSEEIHLALERGWGNRPLSDYPRGQNIPDLVMERGEAIVAREFRSDTRIPEEHRRSIPEGVGGVCIPLLAAHKPIGAMIITVHLPREITAEELRILNALAEIGGNSIHRASLYEQTLKQLDQMAALRSIDIAISSSFDLRMMLTVVLEKVTRQLNVDAADVLLLKPESLILEFAAGQGFWARQNESTTIMMGEGLAGKAALERQTVSADNLPESPQLVKRRQMVTDEKFVSYYGIPLVAKGKVKGVLEIFHRSRLTRDSEWRQFLDALAGQTAIAIDSASMFQDLQRSNLELALAYDATIEGWSHALDLRDKETEGHTLRVTEMALKLAQAMGIQDEQLIHIRRGALLHDIGKMGVPDSILLKPDKLTQDEWEIMRKHPSYAYEMLMPITYLRPALDIPYCHHEKWDGTGYPRKLKGEQIPLAARIFSVVDVWDAVSSDRPYRTAWKSEDVLGYIREQSGKHFDPQVVRVFLDQVVNS